MSLLNFSQKILCCALAATLCAPLAVGGRRTNGKERLTVKLAFVARGTTTSSQFSGRQDDYLVRLVGAGNGFRFARLLHRYPHYSYGLDSKLIASRKALRLRVVRDPTCDIRYEDFANAWIFDSNERANLLPILHAISNEPLPDISPEQPLACYVLL